jgi:hypothetical protein
VRYSLKLAYLKSRTSPAGRDDSLLFEAKFSQSVVAPRKSKLRNAAIDDQFRPATSALLQRQTN